MRLRLQALENLCVGYEQIIFVSVIPNRHVLLNLVDFGGVGDAETVLLSVNGTLLNRRKSFRPTHCHGVGSERSPKLKINLAAGHADFQTGNVFGNNDGVFVVGNLSETVMHGGEEGHALRGENFFVIFAAGRVDNFARFLIVVKSPRNRSDKQVLVHNRHDARRVRRQVDCAVGNHLDTF